MGYVIAFAGGVVCGIAAAITFFYVVLVDNSVTL